MYNLQRVQLVSRPWDRGKIDPGYLLSTKEVVVFTNRVAMSCGQGICRVACTGFSPNKLAWPTLLDQEFEIVVGCLQLDWPADFVSVPRSRATFFAPTRYGRFDFRKSRCFSVNTHECSCCILRGTGEVAATLNCRIGVLGGSYDTTTRGKRSSTHVPIAGKHRSGRHVHGPELSTRYRDSQGLCVGVSDTGISRAEHGVRVSVLVLDSEHNGGTCDPTLVDPILFCEASRPTGTELT